MTSSFFAETNFIQALLSNAVQEFILEHEQEDEKSLVLKYRQVENIPIRIIAEQIQGRRKAWRKLPSYYEKKKIIYPPGINLEQSSSEATALFKKSIIPKGNLGADLTGGFGVDTTWLSSSFGKFLFVEPDSKLLEIAKHNHKIFGLQNISYFNTTAEEFLSASEGRFDMVFVDPSRRTKASLRTFRLRDSSPDVTALQDQILRVTDLLLLKTSPSLDITEAVRRLQFIEKIFVVSVKNECKELLFLIRKNNSSEPVIECVNITSPDISIVERFIFKLSDENPITVKFSDPLLFLYEPNASILKAGAFKSVAANFDLYKLHPSTHFYTSDFLIEDFPGRIFEIENYVKPEAKDIIKSLPEMTANVITRNYPLTPEALRKKVRVSDGGDKYLIAFSGTKKRFVVLARRIK